ncbi:MAG: 3'-5' exonuclease domain-containing protein 2 [Puniceicoccales bacterium]|jgi:ribonuclease D|nr:3'-5' exonuclease domain-containing protein 2 [Puniceicoccales bacterium]
MDNDCPAAESALRASVDRQFVSALPLGAYGGKITLIRDRESADRAVETLCGECVLGFDTETKPSFRRGQHYNTALVQLASNSAVYLFQLAHCGGVEALLPLFESDSPLKVCLGVADDIRRLGSSKKFSPAGFFELSEATRAIGVIDCGLRKLCAIFLSIRISKGEQTSNWAKDILSETQLRYAATDAWVSLRIYEEAVRLRSLGVLAK